jgi:hypothetical protein
LRAIVKASIQGVFGRLPGGPRLYREITRGRMGTQSSHIDKLARAWPGYAEFWARNGLDLEGKDVWMHDGGWTPYPFVLLYLLSGRGGTVTMWEGELESQYGPKAIEYGLKQEFGGVHVPSTRSDRLRGLKGAASAELVETLGGKWLRTHRVRPELRANSIDLLITGGVLEHFRPMELTAFLTHSKGILKPGGWAMHTFDMRDHLYHADKRIPFLNHLRYSNLAYEALYGHRLGYHNRLLPDQLRSAVTSAGYEIVAERRRILPAERYVESPEEFEAALVGLPRKRLAKQFESASEEDLRTVALQFLCRVP